MEMVFYGMLLLAYSRLSLLALNWLAGAYVALSLSHLTILHARRAKTWRFAYQLFTFVVLFLDITIVCSSSILLPYSIANSSAQHVGTDIVFSTLTFASRTINPVIPLTASYSTVNQLRFVTYSIAVFTADLFLVRSSHPLVSSMLNFATEIGLPSSYAMGK